MCLAQNILISILKLLGGMKEKPSLEPNNVSYPLTKDNQIVHTISCDNFLQQ